MARNNNTKLEPEVENTLLNRRVAGTGTYNGAYTGPGGGNQVPGQSDLVTTPEGTPVMSAQEVQNVVQREGANNAAATALPTSGLNVSGVGNAGRGGWYGAVGAAGQLMDPAALLAGAPGVYNSAYAPAMQNLMNQLLNPTPFNYDVNADGLYQQIKDNYTKAGRQAMMDTQCQSAAMTGGYGNS